MFQENQRRGSLRYQPCQNYEQEFFRITQYATQTFKKAGSELLHIRTDEDYVRVLKKFFISRNR